MALPPVLPDTALRLSTRLARDHWVRVGTCDYSVHPKVIGRMVEIRATPDEVVVTCADRGRRLATGARGPSTGPSPTPSTTGPATSCAPPVCTCPRHRSATRSRFGTSRSMTARPGWPDGAPPRRWPISPTCAGRSRPPPWPPRSSAWANGPGARAGPTRSSWPPAWSARWPPDSPTAGRSGSGRRASPPKRPSRTSTSTTNGRSSETPSPTSAPSTSSPAKDNVVFLGPPGTGKTHLATGLGIRACQAGHRVAFATAAEWVARLGEAHQQGRLHDELTRLGANPAAHHRRGRLHPLRRRGRQPLLPAGLGPL